MGFSRLEIFATQLDLIALVKLRRHGNQHKSVPNLKIDGCMLRIFHFSGVRTKAKARFAADVTAIGSMPTKPITSKKVIAIINTFSLRQFGHSSAPKPKTRSTCRRVIRITELKAIADNLKMAPCNRVFI